MLRLECVRGFWRRQNRVDGEAEFSSHHPEEFFHVVRVLADEGLLVVVADVILHVFGVIDVLHVDDEHHGLVDDGPEAPRVAPQPHDRVVGGLVPLAKALEPAVGNVQQLLTLSLTVLNVVVKSGQLPVDVDDGVVESQRLMTNVAQFRIHLIEVERS